MQRRLIAAALALTVAAGLLAGCGAADGAPAPRPEPGGGAAPENTAADPPREEEPPPPEAPGWQWPTDSPAGRGMDAALLEALHTALADTEMYSFVTVKDGYLVDEYYAEPYDETSVFRLASCSKSVTSALVGIAIDEGLIPGVDVSIAQYFPQLAGTDKEGITIRHLLEHTSGIEWYEWNAGSTFGEWVRSDNWVEYILEQPLAAAPGTVFNYTTGGPHLLAAILQQVSGVSLYDYAGERIFDPLGMDSVEWRADDQGVIDGGNGISMTARDAAKFGQLFLNGGSWEGEQLVPRQWVEESTRQQSSGTGSSGVYGYQWWIQTFGGYDTYYAMGHAGQFIFVVPELRLVTVVTSSMSQGTYEPRPYFIDYVLAACG